MVGVVSVIQAQVDTNTASSASIRHLLLYVLGIIIGHGLLVSEQSTAGAPHTGIYSLVQATSCLNVNVLFPDVVIVSLCPLRAALFPLADIWKAFSITIGSHSQYIIVLIPIPVEVNVPVL